MLAALLFSGAPSLAPAGGRVQGDLSAEVLLTDRCEYLPGDQILLSWPAEYRGPALPGDTRWVDEIYISQTGVLDDSEQLLADASTVFSDLTEVGPDLYYYEAQVLATLPTDLLRPGVPKPPRNTTVEGKQSIVVPITVSRGAPCEGNYFLILLLDAVNDLGEEPEFRQNNGTGNVIVVNEPADTEPPDAVCQDITVEIAPSGFAEFSAEDVDGGSTDNFGFVSLSVQPHYFTCSDTGFQTVELTAADEAGNSSTCLASVFVQDTTPPVIVCRDVTLDLGRGGSLARLGPEDFLARVPSPFADLVVGTGPGAPGGSVRVFDDENEEPLPFSPFAAGFTGGVRVAAGDLDGDGLAELIVGAGPGGGPHVRAFSGIPVGGATISDFFAFDAGFSGGVFVAAGDLNGDGIAEIVVGAGAGGGPRVRVFDGASAAAGSPAPVADFFAFDSGFSGGVSVAAGDIDGDGRADVIVGAGAGGPPHVKVFDGAALAGGTATEVHSFFAYGLGFTGGVNVAAGDVNGDGFADVIAGQGPGGTSGFRIFDAKNASPPFQFLDTFFAFESDFGGGINVASGDINGDGFAEVFAAVATGAPPRVRIFNGRDGALAEELEAFGSAFEGGVFLASADTNGMNAFDNCRVEDLYIDRESFDCDDLGFQTVTVTAEDDAGNSTTCVSTVFIRDVTPPSFVTLDVTVELDASGQASVDTQDLFDSRDDGCGVDTLDPPSFDFTCEDLTTPASGPTVVTFTVTDPSGNSSTGTSSVTVFDTAPPTVLARDFTITLVNSTGEPLNTEDLLAEPVFDNCGIESVELTRDFVSCNDVGGIEPVTITATDTSGNTATAISMVTILDGTPPVVATRDATLTLEPDGTGTLPAFQVFDEDNSFELCGLEGLTVDPNLFNCEDGPGPYTVTVTATDRGGNSSTGTAQVTLDRSQVTAGTALFSYSPDFLDFGDVDIDAGPSAPQSFRITNTGCGVLQITDIFSSGGVGFELAPNYSETLVPDAFFDILVTVDPSVTGPFSGFLVVDDNLGGSTKLPVVAKGTGETVDTTPPTAICQDVTVTLDPVTGSGSLAAEDVDGGSTDNIAVASLALSRDTFSCSDIGQPFTVLTVSDAAGNTATCSATVTVREPAPLLTCNDITMDLDAAGMAAIEAADVGSLSNVPCVGRSFIEVSPNQFFCQNIGPNVVTLTLFDGNGATSTCTATVTVRDETPPGLLCVPSNEVVEIPLGADGTVGDLAEFLLLTAPGDNCELLPLELSPSAFTCADLGSQTVTITATDGSGNSTSCTVSVVVVDRIAPTVVCRDATVTLDSTGNGSLAANDVVESVSDNCGRTPIVELDRDRLTCADLGPRTVTVTVTDASGNSATCSATVTVLLGEPSVTCRTVTIQLDEFGEATISPGDVIEKDGSSNCGRATYELSRSELTCADVGIVPVTVTATLDTGSTATCLATVVVEDPFNACGLRGPDDGGCHAFDAQFGQDAILYAGSVPGVGSSVLLASRRTQVGDNELDREERGLLGFIIAAPGQTITRASLRLPVDRRTEDLSGLGDLVLELFTPFAGASASPVRSDFEATPDYTPLATVPAARIAELAEGESLLVELPADAVSLLPPTGNVQVRLRFTNATDNDQAIDRILFGSGGHTSSNRHRRAELIVCTELASTNGCGYNPPASGGQLPLEPIYSDGIRDGVVVESEAGSLVGNLTDNASAILEVGDNASNGGQKAVLSFDTSTLGSLYASARVASGRICLTRKGLVGDPAALGEVRLEMVCPNQAAFFGLGEALEREDYEAYAWISQAATTAPVVPSEDGETFCIELTPAALAAMNRFGATQFRLVFDLATDNDGERDMLRIGSGNERLAADRPRLELEIVP
ncbi:MAG: FG-GAP-like repeat-containing protein [Candidatus Sumerlaeia bacterium]|nr:FG-GAP-like repeat-containing protein [Candidatus Sumerlaeia bacterium]